METAQDQEFVLVPGQVVGLLGAPGFGLTRIGLRMLAGTRGWLACVDVRGWLCPAAAWEAGVPAERLVVVRCSDTQQWAQVTAALVEGMGAVYAEVPAGVAPQMLRRLGALARARSTSLLLRPVQGELPNGITYTRLEAQEVSWHGAEEGHGRLMSRRVQLLASGKGTGGIQQLIEVEDDGTDVVRVVSRMAVAMPERAAG